MSSSIPLNFPKNPINRIRKSVLLPPIPNSNGKLGRMEKLISIDCVGRTVLPKAIREAANLGEGGPARIRLGRAGIIEIEAVPPARRRLKKMGKFLVGVSGAEVRFDAASDVQAERGGR